MAQRAPVLLQPIATAFAVKVILIPQAALVVGRIRLHRSGNVLDVVAVERDQARATLRPQSRHHAGGTATPVVTSEHGFRNVQRVHQRPQIGPKRSLLARAGCGSIQKPGRPKAPQIGHVDTATLRHQQRHHLGIGVNVIREAVHQEHGRATRRTRLMQRHTEYTRVDATGSENGSCRSHRCYERIAIKYIAIYAINTRARAVFNS